MKTKTTPWKHQQAAYDFAIDKPAAYLAMAMGTGKSLVAVSLAAHHKRILVICPKSVLGVWRREFAAHAAEPFDVLVLDRGTGAKKAERLRLFLKLPSGKPQVVVINYESVWRKPMGDIILAGGFGCVILDEAHRIKAPGGKASRYVQRLGKLVRRRLCLSGTPMPHSPLDLYGQFRFMNPSVFGTNFARFRARYALCHQMFPSKVLKWLNQDELQEKFHQHTYQCDSDVLDLPDSTHQTITVPMPPQGRKPYISLRDEMIAEVKDETITVQNALVKLLRLQQITSGYLPGEDELIKLHHAKRDMLIDLLDGIQQSEPVVVFCKFRHDLDTIREVAEKTKRRFGELSGRQRDLTDNAEMPEGIDLYAAQIQSGGVGIDLTRAAYCVYYSLGYSLGDYEQSMARVLRPGQTRSVHYYHLVIEDTVDSQVYAALRARKDVVAAILKHYEEEEMPW